MTLARLSVMVVCDGCVKRQTDWTSKIRASKCIMGEERTFSEIICTTEMFINLKNYKHITFRFGSTQYFFERFT